MLRHKAMIQCARLAFGFAGIFDQDEAERIVERDITPTKPADFAAAADTASDSPETLTIIAALQDVAAEGNAEALQTRWQSLTKEQRKAIGAARWEEIKRLLVIEGEASEVPE
jgi:hypothetical protein